LQTGKKDDSISITYGKTLYQAFEIVLSREKLILFSGKHKKNGGEP